MYASDLDSPQRLTVTDTVPTSLEEDELLAAVDLGSNSFHLIVARYRLGALQMLDRLRDGVQLSAGINAEGRLDRPHRQAALASLAQFGQRVAHLPANRVRAVATNAVRRLAAPGDFLQAAEDALGHPIEVVAGREEARLIWLGAANTLPATDARRLLVDIGGGSTEFVIGQGMEPLQTESVQVGCVDTTRRFFASGRISGKRWRRAQREVGMLLQQFSADYRQLGWAQAYASSGTAQAIAGVLGDGILPAAVITRSALDGVVESILRAGHVDRINLPGLSPERNATIAGGVVIMQTLFEALGVEEVAICDAAMREGLLWDLVGRMRGSDPRSATIAALAERYGVDTDQARRVEETAMELFDQVREPWSLDAHAREWLTWSARVHEIGLDISHSKHHRHAGYILAHADLPGFSQQEQGELAIVVANHRRKPARDAFEQIPGPQRAAVRATVALLRLAVLLRRGRDAARLPALQLESAGARRLVLHLPAQWCRQHPLTMADLGQEKRYLEALGIRLKLKADGQDAAARPSADSMQQHQGRKTEE